MPSLLAASDILGTGWFAADAASVKRGGRQKRAREFGATDIITECGDEGIARIKDLTNGIGGDSVLEGVGTQESMMLAICSIRPSGYVS